MILKIVKIYLGLSLMLLWALWGQFILRESVLRQVDKESRGPQGERGLEEEKQTFFFSFSTFLRII